MRHFWQRAARFLTFYYSANTRFQVHSPFVFELVTNVLEDRRWYYAFRDVEAIRGNMLDSAVVLDVADYGAVSVNPAPMHRTVPLRRLARVSASSPGQGRRLFRLTNWLKPRRVLELGTSVGVGAMYLASAARDARFVSLEGSEACAHVARANLGILNLHRHTEVIVGPFHQTLQPALETLGKVDLAFFDGHHLKMPTLEYFEEVLEHTHERSVLVLDDIYWSAEMTAAWEQIRQHPRVTLTVDCFDLAFVFVNPDFKVKQHFRLVPVSWKPWKIW